MPDVKVFARMMALVGCLLLLPACSPPGNPGVAGEVYARDGDSICVRLASHRSVPLGCRTVDEVDGAEDAEVGSCGTVVLTLEGARLVRFEPSGCDSMRAFDRESTPAGNLADDHAPGTGVLVVGGIELDLNVESCDVGWRVLERLGPDLTAARLLNVEARGVGPRGEATRLVISRTVGASPESVTDTVTLDEVEGVPETEAINTFSVDDADEQHDSSTRSLVLVDGASLESAVELEDVGPGVRFELVC
jgi:hypothetical protein